MTDDQLYRICAETYYWKPMQGFFSVLTLRAYLGRQLHFDPPVLDLGCSDGLFGGLLSRVHGGFKVDAGFDIDRVTVKRAHSSPVHRRVMQADARDLPFQTGLFSTIFSNGVLCCVPGGVKQPLEEAARVLKPGGLFLFTMPTPSFTKILIMPRLLKALGGSPDHYIDRLNARLHHLNVLDAETLKEQIEKTGLLIENITPFFTPREARVWDLLAQHPVRIFGILRKIPGGAFLSRWPLQKFLQVYFKKESQQADCGYMLITARKPS